MCRPHRGAVRSGSHWLCVVVCVVVCWLREVRAISFGPGKGKTLVSYAYFTPLRPVAPRKQWSRCARDGGMCACKTQVRYGSAKYDSWVTLPPFQQGPTQELFVNCTPSSFPVYRGEGIARQCQCRGAGRELAQFQQCDRNFRFFLARGVVLSPEIDFIFNAIGDTPIPGELDEAAKRMPNVMVRRMPRTPLDLCTQGDTVRYFRGYSYYVLINCSTRGPFYPSPAPSAAWMEPFKRKLVGSTHLVGPVINCWARHVHVQSWLLVGDEVAGDAMRTQCRCNLSRNKQIEACELGTSQALLDAGHNIASLQAAYSGIDWRQPGHEQCNRGQSPIACDKRHDHASSLGCLGARPCDEVFVKFGGSNMPLGLIPPATWRRVRALDSYGGVCGAEERFRHGGRPLREL